MFKTQSLFFTYNNSVDFSFPDIELDAGENLLILGESGIGKTTLLHLIAGLLRPVSGSVELLGTSIHQLSSTQLDSFRGQHIGLVFQRPHFIHSLSLYENLALVQYLAGENPNQNRINNVLASLGIRRKQGEKPHRLSQGEQQRAAIALAMVNNPQLILADKPTSSLDDRNCMKVAILLKEQALETGARLIIITHDQRLKNHFSHTMQL
ncbi:ATP-binding cassette domain-containing protein [Reichenbachiella agarivorans]|uniref:ATP-binding cassette domain-containing protein n=1 Tax=Reichenbachiella agarivorans TaxID=2979464 RepID=A0ABY6CJT1_9BACT|nr:ATP-binding cassette domain-containing protein [Reichenbachiella agarivorans]UXP30781.1 ATP-binding cassette domain-containing protein [Reichenbachiella agarivorans]